MNKWTWTTLWLARGTTASCHRVRPHPFALEDFNDFHNTPEKIEQRQMMLRGEWPQEGCEYCQRIEESGGQSDRLLTMDIDWVPPELEHDPLATHVTPRLVEVFLNNTCNLKCIYCSPSLSSTLEKENATFGEFVDPRPGKKETLIWTAQHELIDRREDYVDAFFRWLEDHHKDLYRLHILGGEPFLQAEMSRFVEFFRTHAAPQLELNIVSNLMVKEKNMQNYVGQLSQSVKEKRIGLLHITGSIDAWGPGAEYVRNGLDLRTFESNLLYLLNNPQVDIVGLYQVLTCMTVKEAPRLYEKIMEWRTIRPRLKYGFQFNTDWSKDFMHPRHWGPEPWRGDFDRITDLMAQQQDELLVEMQGAWKSLENTQIDNDSIERCYIYLDELDRRRGTRWRDLFPYLIV